MWNPALKKWALHFVCLWVFLIPFFFLIIHLYYILQKYPSATIKNCKLVLQHCLREALGGGSGWKWGRPSRFGVGISMSPRNGYINDPGRNLPRIQVSQAGPCKGERAQDLKFMARLQRSIPKRSLSWFTDEAGRPFPRPTPRHRTDPQRKSTSKGRTQRQSSIHCSSLQKSDGVCGLR